MGQAVARLALLVAVLALAASCAYGRSQAALGATAFGAMATPAGSKLVDESYVATEWNIDGPNCARLTRSWVSTDADTFLAAFRALAIKTNGIVILMPGKPWFNDAGGGYSPAAQVDVDGTNVNLDFHDGNDTNDSTAWPKGAERRDWPYLILIRIFDRYQGDGGGCHQ